MYNTSIFMLLSWPLLILLSYFAVRIVLFFYEKRSNHEDTLIDKTDISITNATK